jgi:hypothetical protein
MPANPPTNPYTDGTPYEIIPDRAKGSRVVIEGVNTSFDRIFTVNIRGPQVTTNPEAFCIRACYATDPVTNFTIPQYGSLLPGSGWLSANRITAMPLADESRIAAVVTVHYGPIFLNGIASTQVEIGGTNGYVQVSRWPTGAGFLYPGQPILVAYKQGGSFPAQINPAVTAGAGGDPAKNGNIYYQYVSIPVLSPNTIVKFTRIEAGANVLQRSYVYRRMINSLAWQGGSSTVKNWLMRDVQAVNSSVLGPVTAYKITYTAEYNPDGWTRYEYLKAEKDGRVPTGVVINANNNGVLKLSPYPAVDFGGLGLPPIY